MIKPKGKDQYAKAVEYSHTLEELLIMERENSAALRDELAAAERERDEFKALAEEQSQLAGRNAARVQKAEAEIARRDAVAGELIYQMRLLDGAENCSDWVEVTAIEYQTATTDKYGTWERRILHTAASPAVLPPLKKITASVPTDWHKGVVCGWNGCIEMALRLGTQQQKPVFLPAERSCAAEYAGSLLWAETEVWNKAIYECAASLDAAGIPYEVKK